MPTSMHVIQGFPLDKALRYVKLKPPKMIVNDLEMQYALMDRYGTYTVFNLFICFYLLPF